MLPLESQGQRVKGAEDALISSRLVESVPMRAQGNTKRPDLEGLAPPPAKSWVRGSQRSCAVLGLDPRKSGLCAILFRHRQEPLMACLLGTLTQRP